MRFQPKPVVHVLAMVCCIRGPCEPDPDRAHGWFGEPRCDRPGSLAGQCLGALVSCRVWLIVLLGEILGRHLLHPTPRLCFLACDCSGGLLLHEIPEADG